MKRIVFCLMFVLGLGMCAKTTANNVQYVAAAPEETGIRGAWMAKVKSLADNMHVDIARHIDGCEMNMTFNESTADVRCNIFGSATYQGVSVNVAIKVVFGADYTLEGDSIFFDYEGHDLDVDVYSVHVNADDNVRAAMDAMGINSSSIREMLTDRIDPSNFRQLMGYIGDSARYELSDSKTLVLTDSKGRQMQFTRKKGKKK